MYNSSLISEKPSSRTIVSKQRTWHLLSNFNCSNISFPLHNSLRSCNHNNPRPQTSYLEQVTRNTLSQFAHQLSSMHSLPMASVAVDVLIRVHSITTQVTNLTLLGHHQCNSIGKGRHTKDEMDNTKCLVGRSNSIIKK